MADDTLPHRAPPALDGGWHHPRRVAGVLLGLLVAWYAAVAWTVPHRASVDDLRRDAAAGQVSSYWIGDGTRTAADVLTGHVPLQRSLVAVDGVVVPEFLDVASFVWRTTDGRAHRVDYPEFGQVVDGLPGRVSRPDPSDYERAADRLATVEGLAGPSGPRNPVLDHLADVLGVGCGVSVLALALVRRPRTGTRWHWFWMAGLPLGLGLLWFVRSEVLGRPRPDGGRRGGWSGFVIACLVSTLARLLAAAPWAA